MRITSLLSGTRIIEETTSKYNGKITVMRDFAWGTYIKVDGLTQSGGILAQVWKETLKQLSKSNKQFENCLILGLGGGSLAKLVAKNYPKIKITGVDIDEQMVKLGKKYLGLEKVEVKIQDAYRFAQKNKNTYNLILVDLYCGHKFPEKFKEEKFLNNVKKLLAKDGIAIFNRLYGDSERSDSMKMGRALEKIFKKVDYVYPVANVMFVCYN